jgi:succinate-semialdehyde dehydrogenase / glutarate-semialdehyde dehydrogenase
MRTHNIIDGKWVAASSGEERPVVNPATDAEIARVPHGGRAEADAAIAAASRALPLWRARTAADRAQLLHRLAEGLLQRHEELARLITCEQGKPLAEARGEVSYAVSFITWAAEEGRRLCGETIPSAHADKRILVLRQPVGVAACITPWNFPAAMITRKLGPALAAGCTLVVKPAPQTPLTALAIAESAHAAGIPPGVINVITGDAAAIGDGLLENPAVRKLSFTGSTGVGRLLMAKASRNLTRLSLELGGHAPFIVFDDADVDAAVRGAMVAKFRNAGQTCISANRFLIQSGVYRAFAAKLTAAVQQLRPGNGLEDGVDLGPLINDAAVTKVQEHVADAVAHGATVLTGGALLPRRPGLANRFYMPTVLDGWHDGMRLSREETFGPVAPLRRFEDEAEALRLANDSAYGLAAYFYTRDAGRLMRLAEQLEYGIIGANDGAPSTAQAPFGGIKHSGFGREGGHYVMDEYVDVKYLSWGGVGAA